MALSLTKGQKISLEKEGGSGLSKVAMGLGWDVARKGGTIDLDASCIVFDATK
ncbi:MAG: TerD family protein, partial [Planctomycetaceae bacterium]|nr:TerD family protein [Planctomycetaceae bacterium]